MEATNPIIGRKEECDLLLSALRTPRPELIAVFGRRRIGKTFLIRNLYKEHVLMEWSGIHRGTLGDQLKAFHEAFKKKRKNAPLPTDWMDAFALLAKHISEQRSRKKKVIFIDEFPWLDSRRSRFLSAFSHFWNSFASTRNDLVVVICGSAASYMIDNVINDKGGLHNRITQRIHLRPFDLHETELLLRQNKVKLTRYDILQLYMAMSGVPYYLQMVEPGESVAQAIDRLCFDRNGFLRGEFNNVFASLFDQSQSHEAIVRALSKVRKGLTRTQVLAKSKLASGGTLTRTLNELEQSGFIEHYSPYKGSKDPLYRLTDEYALFYLKYIEGTRPAKRGVWAKLNGTPTHKAWAGFTFETICMKHVDHIKEGLKISGIRSVEGSWTGKGSVDGAQVDLLIDRDDNVINLCEMKFSSTPFTIDKKYAAELAKKVQAFTSATRTRKSVFVTFITTYGTERNAYRDQVVQNELTMDALFAEL